MSGSKRNIEQILWEMFYDGVALEYIEKAYSKDRLLKVILQEDPTTEWGNIYAVIKNWQRDITKHYNGINNKNKSSFKVRETDTRDICKEKYQKFLMLISDEKIVPLYYDKDINEYSVAKTLERYEEIMGEEIKKCNCLKYKKVTDLAKRGGQLLSGLDSRKIINDMFEDNKKFEERANNPKLTDRINQMFKELEETELKEKGA